MQAEKYQIDPSSIDYTPGSDVSAGDVIVLDETVAVATRDIASGDLGSLDIEGVFKVAKITGALNAGDKVYWDPAGDPVGGTSGSGAATGTAGTLKVMGRATAAAASGDTHVYVALSRS